MNNECPCRYCVSPKRHAGCAIDCPEWTEWKAIEEPRKAKVREAHTVEYLSIPTHILYPKRKRRRR